MESHEKRPKSEIDSPRSVHIRNLSGETVSHHSIIMTLACANVGTVVSQEDGTVEFRAHAAAGGN